MTNHELDIEIAEKVMGWKERVDFYIDGESILIDVHFGYSRFSPSTNMGDAWSVVNKILEMDEEWFPNIYLYDAQGTEDNHWTAVFTHSDGAECFAISLDSPPVAICLAALKTIEE